MDSNKYLPELLEALKQSDPYKIILFGSYANGTAKEDSDIDILIILDSDNVSDNFRQR